MVLQRPNSDQETTETQQHISRSIDERPKYLIAAGFVDAVRNASIFVKEFLQLVNAGILCWKVFQRQNQSFCKMGRCVSFLLLGNIFLLKKNPFLFCAKKEETIQG